MSIRQLTDARLLQGIFQIKYLYAEHVYEWGAEQVMSCLRRLCRNANPCTTAKLLHHSYGSSSGSAPPLCYAAYVWFPIQQFARTDGCPDLIGWFKPKPKATANTPANPTASNKLSAPAVGKKPKPTLGQLAQEINFDLMLLRCSFFIECISHTLVSLMPSSAGSGLFVVFTTLSCLGTGVLPAVNSLALCILQIQGDVMNTAGIQQDSGDVGRLFGALASIQSIGQMILGVRPSCSFQPVARIH